MLLIALEKKKKRKKLVGPTTYLKIYEESDELRCLYFSLSKSFYQYLFKKNKMKIMLFS